VTGTDPVARQVGAALRSIRRYRDRKQYLVAADAGITKGMLSAYERGRTCPSIATLARLLAALGCTAEQFGHQFRPCPTRPASK
jgi:transcriptional regulator with XRE-family HTH domain